VLFNSLHFALFFPASVLLYFLLPFRWRWLFLLSASYYFYMCWEVTYAFLILFSTAVDYFAALRIEEAPSERTRRHWLWASLSVNLGLLFFFKYSGFAADSMISLLEALGIRASLPVVELLLPVGISFYTFQSLSYTIDVYRRRLPAERHFGIFALYVACWPQLVAGPIERPSHLLPQLRRNVPFDEGRARSGLMQMAWGFFKKLVIADRLALYVEPVYADPSQHGGGTLLIATYFFAFQIYCDFSGYSDIAIGSARVLGLDLMENFRRPYFATSIAEFWSRWHISLSTWFRDYVYVPLGGNREGEPRLARNLLLTFLISGLWHGAAWTFVFWGALHGLFLICGRFCEAPRRALRKVLGLEKSPALQRFWGIFVTFHLVLFGWVFFRAGSFGDALSILQRIVAAPLDAASLPQPAGIFGLGVALAGIVLLLVHEIASGDAPFAERLLRAPRSWRLVWTGACALLILWFGVFNSSEFLYFQF